MGFFDVVSNCIYQQDGHKDYGPDYADDPEGKGACAGAIQNARFQIDNQAYDRLSDTLEAIVDYPSIKEYRFGNKFDIYVTGYVHFFNVDTTDCNEWSFGAPVFSGTRHYPKLSQVLRRDINDLVERVNSVYRRAVADFNQVGSNSPNTVATFVDISPSFNGHRFCELGHNSDDQYNSADVWIWNLSSHIFSGKARDGIASIPNEQVWTGDDNDPKIMDSVIQQIQTSGGMFITDPLGGSDPSEIQPVLGVKARCFHPTHKGHESIKNTVLTAVKGHV